MDNTVSFFDVQFVLSHYVAKDKISQEEMDQTLDQITKNRISTIDLAELLSKLEHGEKILGDIVKSAKGEEVVVESLNIKFDNFTRFNEAKKKDEPKYEVLATKNGWSLVTLGRFGTPMILSASKVEKLAEKDFKEVNLMNDYFSGTAMLGSGKEGDKITDFSDPNYKGQIEYGDEEFDEEVDFKYDRSANNSVIKDLLKVIVERDYIKGTVIKSVYLH
jgi:hypothetical protein